MSGGGYSAFASISATWSCDNCLRSSAMGTSTFKRGSLASTLMATGLAARDLTLELWASVSGCTFDRLRDL